MVNRFKSDRESAGILDALSSTPSFPTSWMARDGRPWMVVLLIAFAAIHIWQHYWMADVAASDFLTHKRFHILVLLYLGLLLMLLAELKLRQAARILSLALLISSAYLLVNTIRRDMLSPAIILPQDYMTLGGFLIVAVFLLRSLSKSQLASYEPALYLLAIFNIALSTIALDVSTVRHGHKLFYFFGHAEAAIFFGIVILSYSIRLWRHLGSSFYHPAILFSVYSVAGASVLIGLIIYLWSEQEIESRISKIQDTAWSTVIKAASTAQSTSAYFVYLSSTDEAEALESILAFSRNVPPNSGLTVDTISMRSSPSDDVSFIFHEAGLTGGSTGAMYTKNVASKYILLGFEDSTYTVLMYLAGSEPPYTWAKGEIDFNEVWASLSDDPQLASIPVSFTLEDGIDGHTSVEITDASSIGLPPGGDKIYLNIPKATLSLSKQYAGFLFVWIGLVCLLAISLLLFLLYQNIAHRLTSIKNLSPSAVISHLPDGTITDANYAFFEISGVDPEHFKNQGGTISAIFPHFTPPFLNSVSGAFSTTLQDGSPDGAIVEVQISTSLSTSVPLYYMTITDISNSYENYKEMKGRSALIDSILYSAHDGIVGVDDGLIITFANSSASNLLGFEPDHMIGQNFGDFFPIGEHSVLTEALARIVDSKSSHRTDIRMITLSGESVPVEISCAKMAGQEGSQGAVFVFSDASESVQFRKLQEQQIEVLNRQNREFEELRRIAIHDLREPLRTINLFSELSFEAMQRDDIAKATSTNQTVRDAVIRLQRLLEGFIAYNDASLTDISDVSSYCGVAIDDAIDNLEGLARERDATIISDVHNILVKGSLARLTGVFQNLIHNALKFVEPGKQPEIVVSSTLRTGSAGKKDTIEILVRDNGIGIPEQHYSRVFEPFKRLHSDEKFEGTGMGLGIVKKTLLRCNGDIQVDWSQEGIGTCFIVTLELVRSDAFLLGSLPVNDRPVS